MKTIQELNSQWYWRLIKVVYIFVALSIFIGSSAGIYYELDNKQSQTQEIEIKQMRTLLSMGVEPERAKSLILKSREQRQGELSNSYITGRDIILFWENHNLGKIILWSLGILILIIIFTFILRNTLYYIILGKFNPEK